MARMNADGIFKDLAKKSEGKTQAAIIFWLSLGLLLIGINNFIEDTISSYYGLIALETSFGIKFGSWNITYWAGSVFFQIITMIGVFIYANDSKNRWALGMAGVAQVIDFFTDVWYRSNSMMSLPAILVGFVLTFVYFTIGSELALTFGLAAVRYTIKDGLEQTIKLAASVVYAVVNAIKAGIFIGKDYWNELESKSYSTQKPSQPQNQKPQNKEKPIYTPVMSTNSQQNHREPSFAQETQRPGGIPGGLSPEERMAILRSANLDEGGTNLQQQQQHNAAQPFRPPSNNNHHSQQSPNKQMPGAGMQQQNRKG